jgi:amidase
MPTFADFVRHDGLGLAELVRKRQVTPLELVDTAIARIESLNPRLNAVVTTLFDEARIAAQKPMGEGAFAGVPFLIKDLLATMQGQTTSQGTKLLRNIKMPVDSEIVRRFRAAGLIIVGRTNTPEFGLTPYTESATLGPARNPWNTERTPGGSSGGSGAAVASRMVPLASGGDGGGSLRIPASCCGLFAMKPSRGRVPSGPIYGELWGGFATEGGLSRSVRDSAALLDAIEGTDLGAPYAAPGHTESFRSQVDLEPGRLRIAHTSSPFMGTSVHKECAEAVRKTAMLLSDLGHEILEAAPPVSAEEWAMNFMTVVAAETRVDIEMAAAAAGVPISSADFEPATYALGLLGRSLKASDYARAKRRLGVMSRDIAAFFTKFDVLLTPTVAAPPPLVGALGPTAGELSMVKFINALDAGWLLQALDVLKPLAMKAFEFIPWTPVFNITGQPAMSVPLHWNSDGLPVGLHFVGRFGDEATLFRLAGQLERAKPWEDRLPPVV